MSSLQHVPRAHWPQCLQERGEHCKLTQDHRDRRWEVGSGYGLSLRSLAVADMIPKRMKSKQRVGVWDVAGGANATLLGESSSTTPQHPFSVAAKKPNRRVQYGPPSGFGVHWLGLPLWHREINWRAVAQDSRLISVISTRRRLSTAHGTVFGCTGRARIHGSLMQWLHRQAPARYTS